MIRRLGALSALALTLPALAQQGLQPTSYSAEQQTGSIPTLQVTANLVIVDVVVRDKNGHPIHGLKQSDFVLLENKAAQQVKYFDEHTSAEIAPASEARPVLPAGTFTNFDPVPEKGPLNILMIDKFNTPLDGQSQLRQALLRYIDSAKPGTRMAIFTLDSSHLKLLQGFTDDRALLRRALTDEDKPFYSGYLTAGGNDRLCSEYPLELVMRDTMRFMSFYLGNLPGRKNLLWFSGSYPFHLLSQGDQECHVDPGQFYWDAAKLADNQVSIYPIPVLENDGPPDAKPVHPEKRTTGELGELARITGGQAFYGDLTESTAEAIEDGSDYYTLAYVPANLKLNGGNRDIELKLTNGRTGELSYRRNYFANDPKKRVRMTLLGRGKFPNSPRPDAMQLALTLGVPDASEVVFVARVELASAKTDTTLASGNEGSKGLKGPYQRYTLHLAVDLNTVKFTEASDGRQHGSIEFVAFVYDLNGKVVNGAGRPTHIDLKPADYGNAMRKGWPLELDVSVPVKGEYTFRLAVHDLNTDRVGAVEVPVSSLTNLAAK